MASPQTENGYTPIANELLEVICATNFNATQLKILFFIMRYTYGFSRKEHAFSLNFISRGIGISKRYVAEELKTLIKNNVLVLIREHSDTEARILKLNKDYETWKQGRRIVPQVKKSSTGEEESYTTVEEQFYTTVEEQFHQDKQVLKQNIKQLEQNGSLTLKEQKKKIKDFTEQIKVLKERRISHGKYEPLHPAYKLMEVFSCLPGSEKLGVLVGVFVDLFPENGVKFATATANVNDIFTEVLDYPLCKGPEDILREVVYYEGDKYSPWDVKKKFQSQQLLKNSFPRMRYNMDQAKAGRESV